MKYQKFTNSCFYYKLYLYPESIIEEVLIYLKGYRVMKDKFGRRLCCWVNEKHLFKLGE